MVVATALCPFPTEAFTMLSPRSSPSEMLATSGDTYPNGRVARARPLSQMKAKEEDTDGKSRGLLDSVSIGDFQLPFSAASFEVSNGMVNDGPFAWMTPYLGLFGYKEGNTLVGAVPQGASSSSNLSGEEVAERRRLADEELTNISPEERERRADSADVLLRVSAAYAAYSSLILDDGSIGGHLSRFAILPLLFFYRGLDLSAKSGL